MQGKLDQYHPIRELAKKYSHVTYLASPTDPQRGHGEPEHQVILTVFASSLFSLPHERENVLQQAQRIQELEHPHLVPILDMGIEEEQPFVVREYLPHDSLRSRLRTLSPDRLELRDALMIVSQVGQALAYAHKHYILHSNLKPENILFDTNGQALLTDFSLIDRKDAILRDQTAEEYAFCYLAPEQFIGTCDASSDQYALGCLAYELISGHVPFVAQSLASLMGHQNNILPPPLSQSVADLPPSLEAAIFKTLAKDPTERFFDFSLFLEVIQSALSPTPAFPLSRTATSYKQMGTSRRTRRPKARTFLSSVHQITASSSPAPELPEAEAMQQSEERIAVTTKRVFDSDQRDTTFSISQQTTNDGTRNSSTDRESKPLVGEIWFAESQQDLDQTDTQQDADDGWLTDLFAEQESHDLPAIRSESLGQELLESGIKKKYEMILSLHRDRPVRRRTQHNRSKVFGLVLLCFIIVASGTYAAFFLLKTSKPDKLVRPIQVVEQPLIPLQRSISPTQLAMPASPTAKVQPSKPTTSIPAAQPSIQITPLLLTATVSNNLIVNGDAESGPGANDGSNEAGIVVSTIPGWTRTGNFNVIEYSANNGDATPNDPGPPNRGNNYFIGGPQNSTDNTTTSATQTIDVSANASVIDTGKVAFTLSGYLGGYTNQDDHAVLTIYFQNASNQQLGQASIGPVMAADRNDQTGLIPRSTNGTIPEGTRTIQVTLVMTKEEGDYNDGSADNLSLVLQY